VVEELSTQFQDDSNIVVVYIYCNYKRQDEQTLEDVLASILKQLAEGRAQLPQSVKALHNQCESKKTRPSIYGIQEALQSVAAAYSQVFVLIDALDECRYSCREKLVSELSNIQSKCDMSLFVTSRFIPDITEKFEGVPRLEIRATQQDIQRYVKGHIDELPRYR
jgi:hypothetical protein